MTNLEFLYELNKIIDNKINIEDLLKEKETILEVIDKIEDKEKQLERIRTTVELVKTKLNLEINKIEIEHSIYSIYRVVYFFGVFYDTITLYYMINEHMGLAIHFKKPKTIAVHFQTEMGKIYKKYEDFIDNFLNMVNNKYKISEILQKQYEEVIL